MANDFYESIFRPLLISMTAGLVTSFLVSRLMERQVARAMESPPYRTEGPPVSVVIPTLREEAYLPPLLISLSNQTYTPIEAIVADSSPSPTGEMTEVICRKYGAKYVYVPELNVARARNEGASAAEGDILVFIDADCIPSPDYIERLVHALEQGCVLAHGVDPNLGGGINGMASVIGRVWAKPRDYTTGRGWPSGGTPSGRSAAITRTVTPCRAAARTSIWDSGSKTATDWLRSSCCSGPLSAPVPGAKGSSGSGRTGRPAG